MAIRCVPKTFGFAHICDGCGASGPVVGESECLPDTSEVMKIGVHSCQGAGDCPAAQVGWEIGERDLCPACRSSAPTR